MANIKVDWGLDDKEGIIKYLEHIVSELRKGFYYGVGWEYHEQDYDD